MFKRKLLTALFLSVAAVSAFAGAAETLTPYTGTLPPALQYAASNGGLTVFKKFPAAGNLDGWVVQDKASGKNIIIYSSKDGEALIAGMMLDKNGNNLSAVYADANIPTQDYSVALADFKGAAQVVVGSSKAKAELYIVFDANCAYCKLMHKLVAPAVDAGELKVHYVPVAILGHDSDVKGAGILASSAPAAALNSAVAGKGETSNDKALLAKIQANTELMRKHGFNGTPVVMYTAKDAGENTVFVSPGVPNIVEMFLHMGIDGKVEKLKQDPSLARYVQ